MLRVYLAFLVLVLIAGGIEYYREQKDLEQLTKGETFADVNGARVRYRLVRSPTSREPLVVFLTGMTASIEQWEEMLPLASAVAPSLTYDRAGTGFSRDSSAHDVVEQSAELIELLKVLKYDGPLVVVSFSLSAPVAKVLMDRYPERVKGMVLLEPNLPEFRKYDPKDVPTYRALARSLLTTDIAAFLGIRRWVVSRQAKPQRTLQEQRAEAVLVSFQHWAAVTAEWVFTYKNEQESLDAKVPKEMPLLILGGHSYDERLGGRTPRENLFEALLSRTSKGDYIHLDEPNHNKLLESASVRNELVSAIQRAIIESGLRPAVPPPAAP